MAPVAMGFFIGGGISGALNMHCSALQDFENFRADRIIQPSKLR
jgi:hypothetical protein